MSRFLAFLTLFYLFLFSFHLSARAEKSPAPDAQPSFIHHFTEPLTLAAVLHHFEMFDQQLTSLSAHFSQRLTAQATGIVSSVEGTVSYSKPERMHIEHIRPERQSVTSDGKDIWIYRHSHNQVIQSSLADWKASDPMVNNLMQFGNYGKMLKAYDAALETRGEDPILILTPKKGKGSDSDFTLRLTLDSKTLFPKMTELNAGMLSVQTQLEKIEFNPTFKKGEFIFIPPPDADVFRNFKPPKLQP